jgi:hypothetical protein
MKSTVPLGRLFLKLHPADCAVIAILSVAVVVAAVRLPLAQHDLTNALLLHYGLLIGFLGGTAAFIHWDRASWVTLARPALVVTVIFTLYSTLGRLGIDAMPYLADRELSCIDIWMFGTDPSLALDRLLTPGRVELFSFVYGAFIPYIYVTIVLNCLGRPALERHAFLTGWTFTYAVSYLGYIFVPARGPGFLDAGQYTVMPELQGGYFYQLVVGGVDATGGLQGAFPSLHVGGSLYLCLFELSTNRLRGIIYLPLVVLIYGATLLLRYHYVIDLIAGTVLATSMLYVGNAIFLAWARARQQAGMPALPGGEDDLLPAAAEPGPNRIAPVFSAD